MFRPLFFFFLFHIRSTKLQRAVWCQQSRLLSEPPSESALWRCLPSMQPLCSQEEALRSDAGSKDVQHSAKTSPLMAFEREYITQGSKLRMAAKIIKKKMFFFSLLPNSDRRTRSQSLPYFHGHLSSFTRWGFQGRRTQNLSFPVTTPVCKS